MQIGFEAEYATNVTTLTTQLHQDGLVGDSQLHAYHCSCMTCDFHDSEFPFRVQRDSSCGGEVISGIVDNRFELARLTTGLQDAAVATDAVPGYSAGFHVHSSVEDFLIRDKAQVVRAFLGWEPTLIHLARGCFAETRNFNTGFRDNASYQFENSMFDCGLSPVQANGAVRTRSWWKANLEATADNDDFNCDMFRRLQRTMDRHATLAIRESNYPTFEFRLWNSTRSAWRMNLFVGLSVAFGDPDFCRQLEAADLPIQAANGVTRLAEALDTFPVRGNVPDLPEMCLRQAHYQQADKAHDGYAMTVNVL